ncbi:MAG TPA: hypothetical protein PLN52_04710, partial [Opitutaceae bacterium]|nr:hypothetical protein [Opitutaceae bacterium]
MYLHRFFSYAFSLLAFTVSAFAQAIARPAGPLPNRSLSESSLVVKNAVIRKDGKPIDGLKLSQHDKEILSPSICVTRSGQFHILFVEKHSTSFALAVYHRMSGDNGATWTEAKNLSEDMPDIQTGRCVVLADGKDRVYAIWRTG